MRIPYTPFPPAADTPAEDLAVVERIQARRAPRPLQPLDRALLHAPPVADGWNAFLGAVRTRTTLGAGVRELAIARVAVCNRAWYEWSHHAPLAVAGGVADAAMALVQAAAGPVADDVQGLASAETRAAVGLGDKEWAVLRLTDEMTRHVEVSDETFAEVRKHFNEREVVELVATVSCYNCVSRFLVALDGESFFLLRTLLAWCVLGEMANRYGFVVGERNALGPDSAPAH
jgi:alkylhydroperoxidase family enzyme